MVERVDTQLAEWKIRELKELAGIFEGFDKTYKERLQKFIAKVKNEVQKIFDTALERIKMCMKGGNQLNEDDIGKLQEATAFEKKISPLIAGIDRPNTGSGIIEEQKI